MLTILVADDEKSMLEFFEIMLGREGYEVVCAQSAERAMDIIGERALDMVITDINMPKAGGMAVLKRSMEVSPNTPVIMITAFASTDTAVSAMKIGAYDYITKPFNVEEIKLVIAKALERGRDKSELKRLQAEVARPYRMGEMLGKSEPMKNIFRMIMKVADSRSSGRRGSLPYICKGGLC